MKGSGSASGSGGLEGKGGGSSPGEPGYSTILASGTCNSLCLGRGQGFSGTGNGFANSSGDGKGWWKQSSEPGRMPLHDWNMR